MSLRLFRSTAIVSGFTFISRILGLARDSVLASSFGSSASMDAFLVALKIPNFMRRLFAEGAFSAAFVPVFNEYKENESRENLKALVASVSGVLLYVLLAITIIGMLAAPIIVRIFAPGFDVGEERYELTSVMLKITFPYILFISLTACAAGILNSFDRFAVPAMTPTLLNIALIVMAVFVAPYFDTPIYALAWGVFIAGILQLGVQCVALIRIGLLPLPTWNKDHPGVKRIMQLMVPGIIGSSASQINMLINTVLASFLVTGSVTWLHYSDRMVEFPLGIFGVALGIVIIPSLSRLHTKNEGQEFSQTIDWALQFAAVIVIPAVVALFMLASPILTTLFEYGEFSPTDTLMASKSLKVYVFGLFGFVAIKILAPGFFARQDTKTPVRIAIKAMVVNILLAPILAYYFAHVGLAAATALAACLNASMLCIKLIADKVYQPSIGWWLHLLRVILASLAMGVCIYFVLPVAGEWHAFSISERITTLFSTILIALIVYLGGLLLTGLNLKALMKAPSKS